MWSVELWVLSTAAWIHEEKWQDKDSRFGVLDEKVILYSSKAITIGSGFSIAKWDLEQHKVGIYCQALVNKQGEGLHVFIPENQI